MSPRSPFTVATPEPLPAERSGEHWWVETDGQRVRLSNLDKVYWPDAGYTKGDLLAYYWNVAPLLLPYLHQRPLTMKRMPDGITGPHFYEKNAPSHTPDWVPRCTVPSPDSESGRIDFVMAADRVSLLFVANLGCIEFHPLHSRCPTIDWPDYLFFDLDPFEPATFEDVLAVAQHVRAALDALGLPSYPKTSGATGMQIYVPIVHGPTYREVRDFVGAVGQAIRSVDRKRVTMEWEIRHRTGKVFIDHNMNRAGANIAAVYSVRPEPGAPVSTPLTWDEIAEGTIRPGHFTIANVHERFANAGDLFDSLLGTPVDVAPALEKLGVERDAERPAPPESPPTAHEPRADLTEYERKRDFDGTPEPGPRPGPEGGNRFVIQKHNATRLHYDLRLEREGALASWAVPKGLPTTPDVRHLAVQTEDHPLEYADFEGVIPQGHYGAGEMLIFDRGTYEPLEWTPGKITFRLHGERHRGEYHLVKTNRDWLIFLSKRSVREQPPEPPSLAPMKAEGGHRPFSDPAWRFEPKLDGIRTLAYVAPDATRLVSRTGRDQSAIYPELRNLPTNVNALAAVIDGEIVAQSSEGVPSFELLQQRMNLASPVEIDRIRRRIPVVLYAFDLLWIDGEDLTSRPLTERRRRLEEAVTEGGPIRLTHYLDERGEDFFVAARDLGLEGIVGKRLDSLYHPGQRTRDWRKIKATRTLDCVILGWTRGSGSRIATFGALLLGAYDEDGLRWIGQVGTGFTAARQAEILARLEAAETDDPPVEDPELGAVKDARWVRPELVCEVEYLQFTRAGKLRAPSFRGLREDKDPTDCTVPDEVT